MHCAEAKEPQWTRATPTSPVAVSRFACHGQCICHSVSTRWSQASPALASVKSFISLFISGPRKPFITGPETSVNYSDGRKSEERQIHLDLIGKQVCSRPLSRFPSRWNSRDNGARKREGRQRESADGVEERSADGGIFRSD